MRELRDWRSLPWRWYCAGLSWNETPRRFFTSWQEIDFLGEKVLCPEKPERLLEFWYGPDWRVPVRGHKLIYRVKSAHYARLMFNRVKKFIASVFGLPTKKR